jgi:hypothetical protein
MTVTAGNLRERFQVTSIGELVEIEDAVIRIANQFTHDCGTN